MAIDTRDKRGSAINVGLPFGRVFPNPNGSIDQGDRQQSAMSYRGIPAAAPGGANLVAQYSAFFRGVFGQIFGRVN